MLRGASRPEAVGPLSIFLSEMGPVASIVSGPPAVLGPHFAARPALMHDHPVLPLHRLAKADNAELVRIRLQEAPPQRIGSGRSGTLFGGSTA
jgi:hypothetical protein